MRPPARPAHLHFALLVVVLLAGAAISGMAASGAHAASKRTFERADRVQVGFTYVRGHRSRTLVRFGDNRVSVADSGHRRLVVRSGGRRRIAGRLPRGRSKIRMTLDVRRQRLIVQTGKRRRVCSLKLRGERSVWVSRAGARRRLRVSTVAQARAGKRPRRAAARPGVTSPAAGTAPARSGAAVRKCCATAPAVTRPFAASSVWNQRLSASTPLDPHSAIWTTELRRQMDSANPWINTTQYSSPVYTVGAQQKTVKVTLDTNLWALQKAILEVPIPASARAAAGTDQHMVISQPSTDTMWEFWKMQRKADGWHAKWGGRMNHVSSNPGYFNDPTDWGATATSLPLLGGMIRLDELRAGRIDHALAMAIPATRAQYFAFPAQRTDGNVYSADAIPEGARFRIDPRVDLSKRPMSPMVRMMAEAAQKYGIVIRDKAGAVTFFAEDPTPTGKDPFYGSGGWFANQPRDQLLRRQFPWNDLQAVKADQQCCWKR